MKDQTFIMLGVAALVLALKKSGSSSESGLPAAIAFISKHEGLGKKIGNLQVTAYPDAGAWSIGYGNQTLSNGKAVKAGDVITYAQAADLLYSRVKHDYDLIYKAVKVPISGNAMAALTSLGYNIGLGSPTGTKGLFPSTLFRFLNQGKDFKTVVAPEFNRHVYSEGHVHPVLVQRRADEAKLFLS